jgi:hypothetical protein
LCNSRVGALDGIDLMGRPTKEIPIGSKFGPLTVLAKGETDKHGTQWLCVCDYCGGTRTVTGTQLRGRVLKSCGCRWVESSTAAKIKHGEASVADKSPEYQTWVHMIGRCENPNIERYPRYGGRGIKVCRRWRTSFTNFLADMGRRPSSVHSIDRINNDGNYEPGNCRWATRVEQANNKSNSRRVA